MLKWLVRVVLAMLVLAVAAPPTEARERGGHHTGHRHHHHRGHAFVGIGPWWVGTTIPVLVLPAAVLLLATAIRHRRAAGVHRAATVASGVLVLLRERAGVLPQVATCQEAWIQVQPRTE